MLTLKLKYIKIDADFRNNEASLTLIAKSENKGMSLGKDDVIVFVSKSRKQILFVYGFDMLNRGASPTVPVLPSLRLRLTGGGEWNPLMLANYAKMKGIDLVGYPKFEQWFKKITGKRLAKVT